MRAALSREQPAMVPVSLLRLSRHANVVHCAGLSNLICGLCGAGMTGSYIFRRASQPSSQRHVSFLAEVCPGTMAPLGSCMPDSELRQPGLLAARQSSADALASRTASTASSSRL